MPPHPVRQVWTQLRQPRTPWSHSLLPGLAVIGLVVMARLLGLLQGVELKTLDAFLRWRPAEPTDARILIVGIDETDLESLNTYPVPDATLAQLVDRLSQAQPRAIGIDIYRNFPVEPGHETLVKTLATHPQVFTVEKLSPPPILPPPSQPPERLGFTDFPLDRDGFVRRFYLGAWSTPNHPNGYGFRFSLPLRLAQTDLAAEGIDLENGRRNPSNMRFGDVELAQFWPNSGGYVRQPTPGVQLLLNPRSGPNPFDQVSMRDVLAGRVSPDLIRDRVVLIGITSLSVKDLVNSAAVDSQNPGLVFGVEMQAQAVSQILSMVLDGRPPLRSWGNGWEYLWIVIWGAVGMGLVGWISRPAWYLLAVGLIGLGLGGLGFGLLAVGGWWLPVVPTLIVFGVNGVLLPGFYLYDQTLRSRLEERQRVIEQTYDAIHSGPLQTLALLLQDKDQLPAAASNRLQDLNRDLRQIYNTLLAEALPETDQLILGNRQVVDLRGPLHEALQQVYAGTRQRDFPGFHSIKVNIVKFEPLQTEGLSTDHRQALCRFLEEALCNVGKHTVNTTRLKITCLATASENLIQVEDNGTAINPNPVKTGGRGTQQARALARRLQGQFQRTQLDRGTRCELRWPLTPPELWPHRQAPIARPDWPKPANFLTRNGP